MQHPLYGHRFFVQIGRKKCSPILWLPFIIMAFTMFGLANYFGTQPLMKLIGTSSTLAFEVEDLQRIWRWEIASGHYPSHREIPQEVGLEPDTKNPALPHEPAGSHWASSTYGVGANRIYINPEKKPLSTALPLRLAPGSIADLDVIMEHCDFSSGKYVRDCLKMLRAGAGLESGPDLSRHEQADDRSYIYREVYSDVDQLVHEVQNETTKGLDSDNYQQQKQDLNSPFIDLPPLAQPYASSTGCEPDNLRIFHMFWTGLFTDKPYLALLSFLYTQNTGLHLHSYPDSTGCRPEFWMWISPGAAADIPYKSANQAMLEQLQANPWSSPFLHPRFKDVIRFKFWNTTDQLDSIPELRDEWRTMESFTSDRRVIRVPTTSGVPNRLRKTNDRISVVLSDMARFILCHRYGGIYLDADSLLLRDWEELWGWKGAFSYRWSRIERYNTAVLRMHKGSALGKFIFKTASQNNWDFHPVTITRYMKDAYSEGLLLRLPDALFDPAWLNTEGYQRERPPFPYFTKFENFFETSVVDGAAPEALGLDGFFKGAYSYHYHNQWWRPFDPSRNWPDLGPRFEAGEQAARVGLENEAINVQGDLSWSAVAKRTFESYIRGESPNIYGEWIQW